MHTQRESFIVRLQFQVADEAQPHEWILRGQIEHTPSGQAWRFASLDELPKILDAYLHHSAYLTMNQERKKE